MIEEIKSGLMSSDEQLQQDCIYLIGCIFEKYRGHGGRDFSEINDINIDISLIEDLKILLIKYLSDDPNEMNRASAFNALRKLCDKRLKKYFLDSLRKELDCSAIVLFQIMIALNDLGEDCFYGRQSLSEFDGDINRALARKYLEKE